MTINAENCPEGKIVETPSPEEIVLKLKEAFGPSLGAVVMLFVRPCSVDERGLHYSTVIVTSPPPEVSKDQRKEFSTWSQTMMALQLAESLEPGSERFISKTVVRGGKKKGPVN